LTQLLLQFYRRLHHVQRGLLFRSIASGVALIACVVIFGIMIHHSNALARERQSLLDALYDPTLERNREAAITLKDRGTITVDAVTYGGPHWKDRADLFIDAQSKLIDPPGPFIAALLVERQPWWVPNFLLEQPETTWLLAAVMTLWLQLIIWMGVTVPFLITVLATGGTVALAWWAGSERWMLALGGIGLLTFTYVLLIRALMILFQLPLQPLAIAHTVVKESTRLRLSLVFVVLLLVGLPLIPMIMIDPELPLRFRIQTFISTSMRWTFGLAAVMTLLLACASVAFEIRDRQIWQLVTKPMSRLNYLLGKWIGIVGIDLVILLVSGVSIFIYTQHMRHLPVAPGAQGQLDRLAVEDQILTARIGVKPVYDELAPDQLRARVDAKVDADAELSARQQAGQLTMEDWRGLANEIAGEYLRSQRVVPPFDPATRAARTYTFRDLQRARDLNSPLSLKYRFFIGESSEHERYPVAFVFNEDWTQPLQTEYTPTVTDVRMVSRGVVQDDGTLQLTIVNLPSPQYPVRSLSFEEKDFEILFKADTFEMNFFRALLASWIKLAFLAMLGLCCATFLSFPVACLLSFTIYFAALIGPFMTASLYHYAPVELQGDNWTNLGWVAAWLFQNTVYGISRASTFVLSSFGQVNPTQDLVEGRLISWATVARALLHIGMIWCGLALALGYLVFRRRELATYSGQG
jgi:ABC-type transport system involved in multi-copper enzyme maturation permease subunit